MGGACLCHLTEQLGLSQPTVSHHLKVPLKAGLVEREQRGNWAYFRVNPEPLELLRAPGRIACPTDNHGALLEPSGRNRWQPAATSRTSRKPCKQALTLATGRHEERMVRRGSTVRVRQRALQKRRTSRFLVQVDLLTVRQPPRSARVI
jgi:DNA-binding transcriptional ArsR family regulator